MTNSQDETTFNELLDENLYKKKIDYTAHCNQLLNIERTGSLIPGKKFQANRCTVYGTNTLLGNYYFKNLR